MTKADRLTVLTEATAIERAGGDWEAKHLVAVLGCAERTVYNTPWLRRIRRRIGTRGWRWNPAEVRTQQSLVSRNAPNARRAG